MNLLLRRNTESDTCAFSVIKPSYKAPRSFSKNISGAELDELLQDTKRSDNYLPSGMATHLAAKRTTPEIALAWAVLNEAAKDLQEGRGIPYRDAFTWMMGNDISWPYSFLNICRALGLSVLLTRLELLVTTSSGFPR